ncbi:hypothetical protein KC19_1G107400 [Ceratodon purpureus]|uniref:Uncharacterized protein n=1 Tax=Ceratodon purpureus TaxID=3225 RepID=A0A8T0J6K5_CERPU|nr:hypothetical protein KC19_1G107400 [Ceratodon purpureus]
MITWKGHKHFLSQQQTQVFSMSHFHANFPGRGRLQRDGELGLPVPASYEGREKTGDFSVFDANPPRLLLLLYFTFPIKSKYIFFPPRLTFFSRFSHFCPRANCSLPPPAVGFRSSSSRSLLYQPSDVFQSTRPITLRLGAPILPLAALRRTLRTVFVQL